MARWTIGLAALGLLLGGALPAHADLTEFSFSYSGTNIAGGAVSGSGYLFGSDEGGGKYLLTSGHGTSTEAGNLTLETAGTWINTYGPSVDLISDNLLTPGGNPVLTGDGLVFLGSSLPATSQYFNIWGDSPGTYTYFNNYDSWPLGSGTLSSFTVANMGLVPEPSSLTIALLGATGFVVAGLVRRRHRRAA
ncbi:MAG: PEP-CTERM sorting domain-containing protein [Isosphaeraceae bacterium]